MALNFKMSTDDALTFSTDYATLGSETSSDASNSKSFGGGCGNCDSSILVDAARLCRRRQRQYVCTITTASSTATQIPTMAPISSDLVS